MRRRDFIGLLGGAVASGPLPAFAQGSLTRPLIVISVGGSKARTDWYFGGFLQGMRELGYAEGVDYGLEVRYAEGRFASIPAQMDELVRLKPDIIVSGTMAAALAAKKLTNTVPIVSVTLVDPIGFGMAASQARPGGNVTGFWAEGDEALIGKQLDLLKAMNEIHSEQLAREAMLDARIAAADAVISTAAVPGRPAPKIISRAVVERMRPGSVVVDLAAEQGGNCELTRAGEVLEHQGVKIIGPVLLAAELAYNASEMYARNLYNFLRPAITKGELAIDWSDEVFAQSCLTHGGQIKHEATAKALESAK